MILVLISGTCQRILQKRHLNCYLCQNTWQNNSKIQTCPQNYSPSQRLWGLHRLSMFQVYNASHVYISLGSVCLHKHNRKGTSV